MVLLAVSSTQVFNTTPTVLSPLLQQLQSEAWWSQQAISWICISHFRTKKERKALLLCSWPTNHLCDGLFACLLEDFVRHGCHCSPPSGPWIHQSCKVCNVLCHMSRLYLPCWERLPTLWAKNLLKHEPSRYNQSLIALYHFICSPCPLSSYDAQPF